MNENNHGLIRKPSELKTPNTIKALIYGQPGIGKTTFAISAPRSLLLDFDGGVHRVNPLHQVDTVQIESWENCLEVLTYDLKAYRTLVIDTAGKMLDYMGVYLIAKNPKLGKANGALTLQGYGERKAEFIAFLKRVSLMGKHIVFVAHDREEKDNDQKIIRPEIGGSSAGDLIKELDMVGYMEAIGKKRTISFDPCEKYYGKNTCGLESLMDIPELKDSKNEFLSAIIDRYNEAIESRKQLVSDYEDLMDLIKEQLEDVTDAETANEYVTWLGQLQHVWDSKLQGGILIRDKAIEIGLVLNKVSKKYETDPRRKPAKKVDQAPVEPVELFENDQI